MADHTKDAMKPQTRKRVPRPGSSPLAAKCLRVSSARPTSQHRREQRALQRAFRRIVVEECCRCSVLSIRTAGPPSNSAQLGDGPQIVCRL